MQAPSESNEFKRGMGALPPPEFAWQMGKTAASIAFVNQASSLLDTLSPTDQCKVAQEIDDIKSGKKSLTNWVSLHQFLTGAI